MSIEHLLIKYRNKILFPGREGFIEGAGEDHLIRLVNSLIKLSKLNLKYINSLEKTIGELEKKIKELEGYDGLS